MQTTRIEKQFALDTNVLIYLEGNDPVKRKIAESLLSLDPVIPSQIISGFISFIDCPLVQARLLRLI
jgi:predicted nucleic acid-binding protein